MATDTETVMHNIIGDLGYNPKQATLDDLSPDERAFVEQRVEPIRAKRAEMKQAMREVAMEHGAPPTSRDMDEYGRFAARTYVNHFGKWNDALEWAGYEPNE